MESGEIIESLRDRIVGRVSLENLALRADHAEAELGLPWVLL